VIVIFMSFLSPDFGRGFLLPIYDICNIGGVVIFSMYQ
jgi:hypothetical protein